MRALHRFCRLSPADLWFLFTAVLLLAVIRLAQWLLPFHTLQGVTGRITRMPPVSYQVDQAVLDRVAWAVTVASRRLPKVGCFAQAVAAQTLLCRTGQPAQLRIGLIKNEDGQLQGHAWVVCGGRFVIGGGADLCRYVTIPQPEGGGCEWDR